LFYTAKSFLIFKISIFAAEKLYLQIYYERDESIDEYQ